MTRHMKRRLLAKASAAGQAAAEGECAHVFGRVAGPHGRG